MFLSYFTFIIAVLITLVEVAPVTTVTCISFPNTLCVMFRSAHKGEGENVDCYVEIGVCCFISY